MTQLYRKSGANSSNLAKFEAITAYQVKSITAYQVFCPNSGEILGIFQNPEEALEFAKKGGAANAK